MNDELRNIISGTGEITRENLIKTALFFLRASKATSGKIEEPEFFHKEDEIKLLIDFANQNQLWHLSIDENTHYNSKIKCLKNTQLAYRVLKK